MLRTNKGLLHNDDRHNMLNSIDSNPNLLPLVSVRVDLFWGQVPRSSVCPNLLHL
jgi:hypothetical protein